MDVLFKKLLEAPGVSGHECRVAEIMLEELRKSCDEAQTDSFGNVIARKGEGKVKVMLAAHMDEIGLMVKYITKEGFLHFIKLGGIDDRILPSQRVVVKSRKGDFPGIIGTKPPHLQKDEERKKTLKYEDMFIDIGCRDKAEAEKKVEIGDAVIFEPVSGVLNGDLCYGKAADNRVGCYVLLKVMEKIKASGASVYAVATAQEEVGLKGARTSSFRIDPDYAIAIDTSVAGDTPGIGEKESSLRLGEGVSITIIEASGRGLIVSEKMKRILIDTAEKNKIKYQLDVIDGGMTDGAIIYMNRQGVCTGVLSVPTRYVHSPSGVFDLRDVNAAVELAAKAVTELSGNSV